jgi:hypothetical protein
MESATLDVLAVLETNNRQVIRRQERSEVYGRVLSSRKEHKVEFTKAGNYYWCRFEGFPNKALGKNAEHAERQLRAFGPAGRLQRGKSMFKTDDAPLSVL